MSLAHLFTGMPAAYRRRRPFSAAVVLVVVLLLAARFYLAEPPAAEPPPLVEGDHVVRRVVDGDTLLMTDGVRVRLIGVDTPETVKPDAPVEPWGKEAAEFTRNFVAGGNVRLRFDRERLDDFGRTLAYVYVGEAMLNEELIRAGLSPARTRFRYAPAMKKRFRTAEDEARRAGRGIWSDKQP